MFNKHTFNFASVVRHEKTDTVDNFVLYKLNLEDRAYVAQLAEEWYKQYHGFLHNKTFNPFFPGDISDENELSYINEFKLTPYINKSVDNNVLITDDLNPIRRHHITGNTIQSIIAFAQLGSENLILFQRFQDYLQLPGEQHTLSLDTDSLKFTRTSESLVTLGRSIMFVYKINQKQLLFKNINDVEKILNVDEYYKTLVPAEIKTFIDDELFEADFNKLDHIINNASPLLAKRFFLVQSSKILKKVDAQIVKSVADRYKDNNQHKINVELTDDGRKIKFPTKTAEVHNLLRLLNQDFYTGDFDQTKFLSKSKQGLN